MFDVAVIGAGVVGALTARELSRYNGSVCMLEKADDVAMGTSKANSAIVHAGFDCLPGSLMAKMNVRGSRLMEKTAQELSVPFERNGSMVLAFDDEDQKTLEGLMERGEKNGVPGMQLLTGDEARALEPALSKEVVAAILAPTGGIVCPYELTIAAAGNAMDNGVSLKTGFTVANAVYEEDGWTLVSEEGESVRARFVVNAAGLYADRIAALFGDTGYHVFPRIGEYMLLDRNQGGTVSHTIFQCPSKMGKGVLVSPTVHGNLLTGPTATDIDNKEQTATAAEELESLMRRAVLSVKGIPFRQVITSFAGLRAHEDGDDFVIGEAEDAPGFFDAAGIESPGLSSAPAIGRWLAEKVAEKLHAAKKEDWNGRRKGIVRPELLSKEERAELIRTNPSYGTIICRCENVSEGEIVDAINRTLGAKSLDGIKRRVRQGMGRCQAGFCTPRTMEILSRELGISMEEVCKNAPGSEMLKGHK